MRKEVYNEMKTLNIGKCQTHFCGEPLFFFSSSPWCVPKQFPLIESNDYVLDEINASHTEPCLLYDLYLVNSVLL